MEKLVQLNAQPIDAYIGQAVACGCGAVHKTGTRLVRVGRGVAQNMDDALRLLAPQLSQVLVISDERIRSCTQRGIEKAVARAGYRVCARTLPHEGSAVKSIAMQVGVPEDTKAVVGVGGGSICDVAKFVAMRHGLGCGLVVTSPASVGVLVPSAMLQADGLEETYRTTAPLFVVCENDFMKQLPQNLTAAALGELAAKAVSLFDYLFAARLNRERFCPHILAACGDILDETLTRLNQNPKTCAAQILAEGSLRFSSFAAFMGNSRLLSGGETQIAHALRALLCHERRATGFRGELEMLSARAASSLYQSVLLKRLRMFVPPPDNNRRLHTIGELLGIDPKFAMHKIRALSGANALSLAAYRLAEFHEEFLAVAEQMTSRLQRAFVLFKRLYADDGYQITHTIEQSDLSLAVALAPDLKEKYTMLSYMKDAGLLENLLMQF